MRHPIRTATADEVSLILAIEDLAGRIYAGAGLPADLEGLDEAVVEAAIAERMLWVIVDAADRPLGFALCWTRGDALHLRELDVVPEHMSRPRSRPSSPTQALISRSPS